jgi:hypothetical protein
MLESQAMSGPAQLIPAELPCPFCGQDLAPLFEGLQALDSAVRCVRCLAAVLFTVDPADPEHPGRLEAVLREYSAPGETAPRLELRAAASGDIYLIAAWDLEERVAPALAAATLGLSRAQLAGLLATDEIASIPGGEPTSRLLQPRMLIPRSELLRYMDRQ